MADPIATSSIAAQAFRLMELSPISSFADTSPQATDAAEQYPVALDMCLEAYDWSFARAMANLPPATPDATFATDSDMAYAFKLPGDLLALRKVGSDTLRWRREGVYLRADTAGPLDILYTRKVTNEALLPATFRDFVGYELAARLAPRWVATRTKREALKDDRDMAFALARDNDRLSGGNAPDWIDWASEATA